MLLLKISPKVGDIFPVQQKNE
ncbi:hypothetical protein EMIT0232MI5_90171 [Pseudomonas sp. IT-232MI5]